MPALGSGIQGYDKLQRQLAELENLDYLSASKKGLEVIKVESQANTPVDTGELQENQFVEERDGEAVLVATMEYATAVEFGTSTQQGQPFMRPAIDNKSHEAVRVIADDLDQQIKEKLA